MELSTLSENIVTETFQRNGESVDLKINIDAFVPDYYDVLEDRLSPIIARLEGLSDEHRQIQQTIDNAVKQEAKGKRSKKPPIDLRETREKISAIRKDIELLEREVFAERLTCPVALPDGSHTCLLKEWNTTHNGTPIPPSKENLMKLPSKAVRAIWEHVEVRLNTVKKTVDDEMIQGQMTPETMETGSQEFTIPLNAPLM